MPYLRFHSKVIVNLFLYQWQEHTFYLEKFHKMSKTQYLEQQEIRKGN